MTHYDATWCHDIFMCMCLENVCILQVIPHKQEDGSPPILAKSPTEEGAQRHSGAGQVTLPDWDGVHQLQEHTCTVYGWLGKAPSQPQTEQACPSWVDVSSSGGLEGEPYQLQKVSVHSLDFPRWGQ